MKRLVQFFMGTFLITQMAFAQIPILWGPTAFDGAHGSGTILKINGDGTNPTNVYSLKGSDGTFPGGTMVLASNNKLYGMAFEGGAKSSGVIYSVDPSTGTYADLHDIDTLGTAWVNSSLVQVNDSILYGLIFTGGPSARGTLFSFNINSKAFVKEHYFDTVTGQLPRGIMMASNKVLYGTNDQGGLYGRGNIFSFNPLTKIYADLHDFDTSVSIATGTLVQMPDSMIYGLISGATVASGIFNYNIGTGAYNFVNVFHGLNGLPSWINFMTPVNGKLYGMTTYGGASGLGVIFRFDPSTSKLSDLKDLDGTTTGSYPISGLTLGTDGKLYGMVNSGGANALGTIIKFNPSDSSTQKIYDFTKASGDGPYGGLTQVGVTTGIDQVAAAGNTVSIFPNPSTRLITISSQKNIDEIKVTNVLGQVIYDATPKQTQSTFSIKEQGEYFISIVSQNQTIVRNINITR